MQNRFTKNVKISPMPQPRFRLRISLQTALSICVRVTRVPIYRSKILKLIT